MNDFDKEKIESIIKARKQANVFYSKNSKVYEHFTRMELETYQDKYLLRMQKELIAVGISVVINCESCMEWHIKQALDCGASKEQLLEAIEVGIEMGEARNGFCSLCTFSSRIL